MAPRNKTTNAHAQLANNTAPQIFVDPPPSTISQVRQGLAQYSEVQQNEFLATEAIYPDGFIRLHGRKDAWKNSENLAFQVRLTSLENPKYFVKIDFELPHDYPKVVPKVTLVEAQPANPTFQTRVADIVGTIPRQHIGSESVHEVTGALDDLLNRTAYSKAAKETKFSLEEERANRETVAKAEAIAKAELLAREQAEKVAENEKVLSSQIESERKRRQQATLKSEDTMPEFIEPPPPEPIRFDQLMVCSEPATGNDVKFKSVSGGYITLKRSDKVNIVVNPVPEDQNARPPQLLLKKIILPSNLAPKEKLCRAMEEIEQLLESSKKRRHPNVVDVVGYQVVGPTTDDDSWQLSILTEVANKDSLGDLLQLSGALEPERVRSWSRQLLEALKFFELQSYVHPAVHAGNVLLFLSDGEITIKLSDGYGTVLRDLVDKARDPTSPAQPEQPLWRAPELSLESYRTTATCVWDFGKVLMQMAYGYKVFEAFTSPQNCIDTAGFTYNFGDLLDLIFASNPQRRPSARKLLLANFYISRGYQAVFSRPPSHVPGTPAFKNYTRASESIWENEWDEKKPLGRGGFGQVFQARNLRDRQFYAVKVIQNKASSRIANILEEVYHLSTLNHPAIVRYFNSWTEDEDKSEEDESSYRSSYPESSSRRLPRPLSRNISSIILGTGRRDMMAPLSHLSGPPRGPEYSSEDSNPFAVQSNRDADNFGYSEAGEQGGNEGQDEHAGPSTGGLEHELQDEAELEGENPFREDLDKEESVLVDTVVQSRTSPFAKLYLVMELCERRTLRHLIGEGFEGDLPSMWRLFRTILDGLAYMHAKGIVHRDLKPDNIFIDSANNPKIGDLGLARPETTASDAVMKSPAAARGQTTEVGTAYYMAPEVETRSNEPYGSKVDMYAMGIILFEMNYQMPLWAERAELLTRLRRLVHSLPSKFQNDDFKMQGKIILELVDHDPHKRPSADALLKSGNIPEPLEDEVFARKLAQMSLIDRQALVTKMFTYPNDTVQDLAWDYKGGDIQTETDPVITDFVMNRLQCIFQRHGAVHMPRQPLHPESKLDSEAIQFLSNTTLVMQLTHDNTVPFARSIAQSRPLYSKIYCLGSVYRSRPGATGGDEPMQLPEADFDFISNKTTDLALKEAEVIAVLDEVIPEYQTLSTRSWTMILNHIDLLDLILDFCRIDKLNFEKVKATLSQLHQADAKDFEIIREILRGDTFNIHETSIITLKQFNFQGNLKTVTEKLSSVFQGDERSGRVSALLARLGSVIEILDRLKLRSKVQIFPLSNNHEQLYRGSVVFQLIENDNGVIVGAGGRYDSLIQKYQKDMSGSRTRAVGCKINVSLISNRIQADLQEIVGTKAYRSSLKDRQSSLMPSRCDVLVTSFDARNLQEACVSCIRELWTAGISAEVTEAYASMEQLDLAYEREGPYWLVIIKGGTFKGGKAVKIRSPTREESEVRPSELVGFFKANLGSRQTSGQEATGGKLTRTTSSGHASGGSKKRDVQVIVPQHRSKKINRQNIIDNALMNAKELSHNLAEHAPIIGIEANIDFFKQIRNTRLTDDNTWKSLKNNTSLEHTRYLEQIHQTLKDMADEGKEGVFIYSYTTKSAFYYDFGRST